VFGLSDINISKINSVFARFPSLNKVVIYGSRAKGNYKVGSDIDLMLFGDNFTHKDLLHISFELDELLTPYQFDLSIYSQVESNDLLEHVNRIGKIFYQA
jgi:predicted nucleotidyltransferase|tara:strand:- start:2376 stop:2675 length:300 start_codon:yes stop_codon:yes gene_type:complete